MSLSTISTSPLTRRSVRSSAWLVIVAGSLALAPTGTAHARIDPGPAAWHHPSSAPQGPLREGSAATDAKDPHTCPLRRVATTFVRCDDLTGNDVPAPSWILER